MIFSNPPLVELIAELRWVPGFPGPQNQKSPTTTIQLPIGFGEESLEKFRASMAKLGFSISERLVPVGLPLIPFGVAQRFRKPPNGGNYLYQIGMGVFSANALPPYRDWESFKPIVQEGVKTLLSSRHASDNANMIVTLRYLDLFTDEFTEGRKSGKFLNDILGIKLSLPVALTEHALNLPELRAGLQLSFGLKDDFSMNLGVQEGTVGTKTGILMSTEVLTVHPIAPELKTIMESFEQAHSYIRSTFLGLTSAIRAKMKPIEG